MTSEGSHITWLDVQEAYTSIISSRILCPFQAFNSCFSEHEYLLGDLAFDYFPFIVGAYKWTGGQAIDNEEQIFNDTLASPCVLSEHTMGMGCGKVDSLDCTPFAS